MKTKIRNFTKRPLWFVEQNGEILIYETKPKGDYKEVRFGEEIELEIKLGEIIK